MAEQSSVLLEVITSGEMLFKGNITILTVDTFDGKEAFKPRHNWCCKPLAEESIIKFRTEEDPDEVITFKAYGGHVDIKGHFIVYADKMEKVNL